MYKKFLDAEEPGGSTPSSQTLLFYPILFHFNAIHFFASCCSKRMVMLSKSGLIKWSLTTKKQRN